MQECRPRVQRLPGLHQEDWAGAVLHAMTPPEVKMDAMVNAPAHPNCTGTAQLVLVMKVSVHHAVVKEGGTVGVT